ncbi:MAG: glycosyltransferase family 4 protein [Planctomycetes bacterium]|nr:glycosyltransferase family 4 protein [Planctomycetota bacterium]
MEVTGSSPVTPTSAGGRGGDVPRGHRLRVLLTHYRYFPGGGPERYLFAVEEALRRRGHPVFPFSLRSTRNRPSECSPWFAPPPDHEEAWYLHEHRLGLATAFRLARRAFYDPAVRSAARAAIRRFRPQVSYVLHYQNKLSPAVIEAAVLEGVPVILRLSDYHLSCARADHLRDDLPCDECLGRLPWPAVRHRCVKSSLAASLVRAGAMTAHRFTRVHRRVAAFVAPSRFMAQRLVASGLPAERVHHIPTFVQPPGPPDPPPPPPLGGRILYAGRLSPEKGLGVLLEAYARLGPFQGGLDLVGGGDPGERQRLEELARRLGSPGVRFHGPLDGEALAERFRCAAAVAVPSLCYENLPNAILEAMAWGRPVVTSRLGSLPEALDEGVEGILVPPGDAGVLAAALGTVLGTPGLARRMGEAGRRRVRERHSPERHLERLEALFEAALGRGV